MDASFYMDDFYEGDVREDTIAEVKKILDQCPKGGPLPHCPLSILKEMPAADRSAFLEAMPLEQLEAVVWHHRQCERETKVAMNF